MHWIKIDMYDHERWLAGAAGRAATQAEPLRVRLSPPYLSRPPPRPDAYASRAPHRLHSPRPRYVAP